MNTALKNKPAAPHPIKVEYLDMSTATADAYVDVMREWLEALNFNDDCIEAFESRSRDGFSPYSHNLGGLEGVTYRSQYSACQDTGFSVTDAVLERGSQYERECFLADNNLAADAELTDEQQQALGEYEMESDDKLELEIKFKTPAGMKRQLSKLLKHAFVARLARNVREGF